MIQLQLCTQSAVYRWWREGSWSVSYSAQWINVLVPVSHTHIWTLLFYSLNQTQSGNEKHATSTRNKETLIEKAHLPETSTRLYHYCTDVISMARNTVVITYITLRLAARQRLSPIKLNYFPKKNPLLLSLHAGKILPWANVTSKCNRAATGGFRVSWGQDGIFLSKCIKYILRGVFKRSEKWFSELFQITIFYWRHRSIKHTSQRQGEG